jgi:hypothetical protein
MIKIIKDLFIRIALLFCEKEDDDDDNDDGIPERMVW